MELHRVARLDPVVEFLDQPLFELAVDGAGLDFLPHHVAGDRLQRTQQQLEIAQVLAHGRVDAGVLDLDRDFLAALEARAMDLAERGGGEGARLEIREELLGALAEFAADLLRDHRIVHRRHAVARGLEQIDRFDRQQVLPHREHLHQLHERAAQLGGTFDDALGVADVGVEQFALVARGVEEGLAYRSPQVAGADLRGEAAHLQRAARASRGDRFVRLFSHGRSRAIPTRLISVAAKAAPKPLSMLTTVTPLAHELSIPSNAATPPNAVP